MKLTFSLLVGVLLLGAAVAGPTRSYTVKPGDTLYQLARQVGVSPQALLTLNGLEDSTLRVGQTLKLPAAAKAPSVVLPKIAPPKPAPNTPKVQTSRPVQGPQVWQAEPAATVASFVGWSPVINTASFGNVVPTRTYLRGLGFEFQTFNNCGPSALSAVLAFYNVHLGQSVIQRATRRGSDYMQVSAIAPELAKFGLKTRTLQNGQLSQIKKLLALGIPVIVLQWYDAPGHINHFRVVRGYDDQAGLMWVSDSMVGPVSYLSYRDFDALWNTQGRQLFPVYPAEYDAQVKTIL
ncbi:LysM peptidoglycan-binding domain-containing protein [Deinococcus sp.]|uniref:LysM peptidoglycan-binding domain-containing protein n=1 Tax=Deinococcus sp. TaxID=47478 RepID=UPI003B5A53DB